MHGMLDSVERLRATDQSLRMDSSARYFLITFNSILSFSATFTNLLVTLAIVGTPTLHTPSNVLLCSLALSDFGVGLLVQPMFIVTLNHGEILKHFLEFASLLLFGASFFTMTAIAVDRYLALVLHMRYRALVTVRRVSFAVIFIWSFSLLANGLRYVLDFKTKNAVVILGMCSCLVTSTYCYLRIHGIVRRHKRQIKDQTLSMPSGSVPTLRQGKSITTMYYIHALFIVCVMPFPITLGVFVSLGSRPETVLSICSAISILFLNSSINPYLYCWREKGVRRKIKSMFVNLKTRIHEGEHPP